MEKEAASNDIINSISLLRVHQTFLQFLFRFSSFHRFRETREIDEQLCEILPDIEHTRQMKNKIKRGYSLRSF